MLGLRDIAPSELRALHFRTEEAFRKAVRIAAHEAIPVEAPGRDTLIVSAKHVPLFDGLKCSVERVAVKVDDPERAALRRRHFPK